MKWKSLADGQVFQDQIKIYPPLLRVDIRKAYSNGNLMSKKRPENQIIQREKTRRVSGVVLLQH